MNLDQMTKDDLIVLLKEVVKEAVETHPLSEDEIRWVRLAIEAEAQKKAFRQAVIDKTLIGLFSAALLWAGSKLVETFLAHWK